MDLPLSECTVMGVIQNREGLKRCDFSIFCLDGAEGFDTYLYLWLQVLKLRAFIEHHIHIINNVHMIHLSKQLDQAKKRVSTAAAKTIVEYVDTSANIIKQCVAEYRIVAKAVDAKKLSDGGPE